eukprot:TRINITY_DN14004_c0_g1_i1.p1 TRINITY_DN14004_c0_g1~~TRINITY_DN14004_c0_g1_i1.p1  ORF type:complete len:1095 (+),score=277.47 TRINITY_DN14004_c0_g1_i1:75-3359(+)
MATQTNEALLACTKTIEQQKLKLQKLRETGAEHSAVIEQEHKLKDYDEVMAALLEKPDPKQTKKAAPEVSSENKVIDNTPKGAFKQLGELQAAYDPEYCEKAWGEWWEQQGYFQADSAATGEPFVMVIPPPNVTGTLHLGHALTNSVEDCLVRYHRMLGRPTVWVPGVDHAGIATQAVVERMLYAQDGTTRHDLGREKFLEKVWEWKNQYGNRICEQLRRLGSSLDWTRNCFTMDEKLGRAVKEAFVRMFNEGLIYRSSRLVNWCCKLATALSDDEVNSYELDKPEKLTVPGHGDKKYEFGFLWKFAYKLEGSDDEIVIATTRPETLLGDTAVAVNPDDARYTAFHGKRLVHPFRNCTIPVITDRESAKIEFGTGAVKITPAHDQNDFETGKRHNLEVINMMNVDGTINEVGGELFQGMKRYDAREKMIAEMKARGLYRDAEPNKMVLKKCSRTGDIIEPLIKPQWYVKCEDMAREAVNAVKTGELNIQPPQHQATWYRWMENCRDWCISRQLWWGHRIPAYFVKVKGQVVDSNDMKYWLAARDDAEATSLAAERFGVAADQIEISQDEDVLDTWFSSGLFPFSVFGWPEANPDLERFYPISVMETGHDILFFWVARMVMMGQKLTGKLPFKTVFLHAMVRDAQGRKMSKSLGNVIDPLDVIEGISLQALQAKLFGGNIDPKEIGKAVRGQTKQFPFGIPVCGTDALRFALCAYTSQGLNVNLDVDRVLGYRQFCNKVWNACKFAMMNLGHYTPLPTQQLTGHENVAMKWILSRLNTTCKNINDHMSAFDFSAATTDIYSFFLYELCDVYLEVMKPHTSKVAAPHFEFAKIKEELKSKPEDEREALLKEAVLKRDAAIAEIQRSLTPLQCAAQETLFTCLDQSLRMFHPFMPFITEELWQRLPRRASETSRSIMISAFPQFDASRCDADAESQMATMQKIIHCARAARSGYDIAPGEKMQCAILARSPDVRRACETMMLEFETLAQARSTDIVSAKSELGENERYAAQHTIDMDCDLFIILRDKPEIAVREIGKLKKARDEKKKAIEGAQKKMAGPGYAKVPPNIQEADAKRLKDWQEELNGILGSLAMFEAMQ